MQHAVYLFPRLFSREEDAAMEWLERTRERRPLVECLTNMVTVNDVANCILAVGASPVMAVEKTEAKDIVSLASAVLLNIGTITREQLPAYEEAAANANALGKPLVLDPVGAGATAFRTQAVRQLLASFHFTLIRGNASEIAAIEDADKTTKTAGVDAAPGDAITDDTLPRWLATASSVARRHRCIVVISGAVDVISDGDRSWLCRNGVPQMPLVTGTGCSLTGLCAAFQAVADESERADAAAAASALMGCAGEIAWKRSGHLGLGSFRQAIVDCLSTMDDPTLAAMKRVENA